MTDYYPLLARAVAGLEKNTGEARRALYERARNALLAQLRGTTPPLSEPEITRERLALEEAVRKVEAEAARAARFAPPPPPAKPAERPPASERAGSERPSTDRPASERPASERPGPERPGPERPGPERPGPERPGPDQPEPERVGPPAPERPRTPQPAREPPSPEGIKGLRDVIAEAETLGNATAQASRTAREAYAAVPSNVPELDRVEPRTEPPGLRPSSPRERQRSAPPPPLAEPGPELEDEGDLPPRRPPGPLPRRDYDLDDEPTGPNPARRGLIAAILTLLVIASLGAAAYWQRERISNLFGVVRNLGPAQREATQPRPKIEDRVGQEGVPTTQPSQQESSTPGAQPSQPPPAVAQRVVLYEEDPNNPQGNRYVGSALWRTETVSPGPGLSPELAIRVDVEVPERRLQMTMSIRRNTDQALPASHTVEIMFNLPPDFPFGGVANVPGLLMKEAEQARGAPLSGLAVKVTNGFFLIGLSAVDADRQRNLQLLQERSWFDIPVVYNNGRRAILAVEKGTPGERAFGEAFTAWRR